MGVYYRYVNHTSKEIVDLEEALGLGRKDVAAVAAGHVLAYLLTPIFVGDYGGRWRSENVAVSSDNVDDWYAEDEERGYRNITADVVAELDHTYPIVKVLVAVLVAQLKSRDGDARAVCHEILEELGADGMGGCRLCCR